MTTIDESDLSALLSKGAGLRLLEPRIYSVICDSEFSSPYDSPFGNIYDRVACNPLYNRLIWGYSIAQLASFAHDALISSKSGNVLDLGCGSLAFTAKTYLHYSGRPVVLVDQSLKMLRIAKSRLIKLNGRVPDNMVFLHADALRLPFRKKSFDTIISQNLLHCLADTKELLAGLKNILSAHGRMYFTTLIRGNRIADKYLQALADSGKLVSRNMEDHQEAFNRLNMPIRYDTVGNMAFLYCAADENG